MYHNEHYFRRTLCRYLLSFFRAFVSFSFLAFDWIRLGHGIWIIRYSTPSTWSCPKMQSVELSTIATIRSYRRPSRPSNILGRLKMMEEKMKEPWLVPRRLVQVPVTKVAAVLIPPQASMKTFDVGNSTFFYFSPFFLCLLRASKLLCCFPVLMNSACGENWYTYMYTRLCTFRRWASARPLEVSRARPPVRKIFSTSVDMG